MEQKILSIPELAKYLGISMTTLARMRRNKKGPPEIRISEGRVGFQESDITKWLNAKKQEN